MNYEFKGRTYDYSIIDDKLTIFKKKDIVFTGNISDIVILCFVEKNILGAGQIVLSLPDRDKVFLEGFREKDRDNYIKLFQILKDKTEFLNLSYTKAVTYVKPEAKETRELQKEAKKELKNEKKEQKDEKKKLLIKGFRLIEETKCTCTKCNETWFYGKQDKMDDFSNKAIAIGALMQGKTLTGSYHEQLVKDKGVCPKCGSRAIARQKVKYWFNSKTGESIEVK